jgi:branched-chain amino acid transport system substrate-binding protein
MTKAIPYLLALLVLMTGPASAEMQFRVGATVSETGHFTTEIGPFRKLLEAWAEDLNAQGGIQVGERRLPVDLIVYDDRSDEATARRMYERLAVVDGVDLMLGPYSSPLTMAASTAAESHSIPFVAICANSPKIYTRGYRWIVCIIDKGPRYTYRYWEMIAAEGKAQSVVFVVEDTLHPQSVFAGARSLAGKAGLTVTGSHVAPRDARDFSAILVKLRQSDADIVFISANIPFAVQFMAQAREMGLAPREFHAIHHSGIFLKSLGAAAEQVTGQSYWTPGMTRGQYQRFQVLLDKADINLNDYPWSPAYMMAFEVVEAALKAAGDTDPKTLMATLKTSQTETIGGVVRFAADGAGSINTYPSQIQQGRYKIVWPPAQATGHHIYPREN